MATRVEQIQTQIAALHTEVQAINDLLSDEERQPNTTEESRLEEIWAELGQQGDKPTGLYAQLKLAQRIERELDNAGLIVNKIKPQRSEPVDPEQPKPIVDLGYVPGSLKGYAPTREGKERAYKAGRFLAAALYGRKDSAEWCNQHGMAIRNAMETGSNTLGGFLVPTEFSQAIIDLRETYGVFRQNVRVVQMTSDVQSIPRRLAGVTAYAVGDNTEITASDKTWANVEVVAKKWGALVKYSSELAEDAFISLADDLASEIAYAFARKEDDCGFIGDGTSTYHGVTGVVPKANDGNHAGTLYTAATGNTAFSTLDVADFQGMMGQLPQYAAGMAKWYVSRVGYYQSMERLMAASGGVTMTELSSGLRVPLFLGYPVVFSQVMNSTTTAQVSTAGLALFGDLNLAATMGERRGFTLSVSDDRYFELDQIGIKGTARFGINVHDLGDASTAGPLIVLKTPAS